MQFPRILAQSCCLFYSECTFFGFVARELIQSVVHTSGRFQPDGYAKRIAAIFKENRIVGLLACLTYCLPFTAGGLYHARRAALL